MISRFIVDGLVGIKLYSTFDKFYLIAYGKDIKIYQADTGQFYKDLTGHQTTIIDFLIYDGLFISYDMQKIMIRNETDPFGIISELIPKTSIEKIVIMNNLLAAYSTMTIEIYLFNYRLGLELSSLKTGESPFPAQFLIADDDANLLISFNKAN